MKLQNYETKREKLVETFKKTLTENPELKNQNLKISWSNWGFGI